MIFLSGIESVQFLLFFIDMCIAVGDPGGGISLTVLTPKHLCLS